MEPSPRPPFPTWVALAAGVAAWLAVQLLSGRREAWDSPLYLPLLWSPATLGAAWLGARHGRIAARWLAAFVAGQSLGLLVSNGLDDLLLWPLGLALLALAHLPALLLTLRMARAREGRAQVRG